MMIVAMKREVPPAGSSYRTCTFTHRSIWARVHLLRLVHAMEETNLNVFEDAV